MRSCYRAAFRQSDIMNHARKLADQLQSQQQSSSSSASSPSSSSASSSAASSAVSAAASAASSLGIGERVGLGRAGARRLTPLPSRALKPLIDHPTFLPGLGATAPTPAPALPHLHPVSAGVIAGIAAGGVLLLAIAGAVGYMAHRKWKAAGMVGVGLAGGVSQPSRRCVWGVAGVLAAYHCSGTTRRGRWCRLSQRACALFFAALLLPRPRTSRYCGHGCRAAAATDVWMRHSSVTSQQQQPILAVQPSRRLT